MRKEHPTLPPGGKGKMIITSFLFSLVTARYLHGLGPDVIQAINQCITGEFETTPTFEMYRHLFALSPYLETVMDDFGKCKFLLGEPPKFLNPHDYMDEGYLSSKFEGYNLEPLSRHIICTPDMECGHRQVVNTLAWILRGDITKLPESNEEVLNLFLARVFQRYLFNGPHDAVARFKLDQVYALLEQRGGFLHMARFFQSLAHVHEHYDTQADLDKDLQAMKDHVGIIYDYIPHLSKFIWLKRGTCRAFDTQNRLYNLRSAVTSLKSINITDKAIQEALVRWIMAFEGNSPYLSRDELEKDLILLSHANLPHISIFNTIPVVMCTDLATEDKRPQVHARWLEFYGPKYSTGSKRAADGDPEEDTDRLVKKPKPAKEQGKKGDQ